jgi:hypothetical protein
MPNFGANFSQSKMLHVPSIFPKNETLYIHSLEYPLKDDK